MDYDPIKDRLGKFFWRTPTRTRAFFRGLDLVFLRSWYVRRRLRSVLAGLPADKPVRVLDAGTGFGQYTYWLVANYPQVEVTAVDVKQDYLSRAEAFLARTPHAARVRFEVRDLTLPPPPAEAGRYDLVLSVDVMEHIEDDRAVFRGFSEVLASGGVAVINTPSVHGGSGVSEENADGFIGEHVRDGYGEEELREKLEAAGLTVREHEYTYGRAGMAAWRLLVRTPIAALSRSWALAPLVALYYLPALPIGLALNAIDMIRPNLTGAGHLIVAERAA